MKDAIGTKYIVRVWNELVNNWVQVGRPYAKVETAWKMIRSYGGNNKFQIIRREVQESVIDEVEV